jgi:hypothetical protein
MPAMMTTCLNEMKGVTHGQILSFVRRALGHAGFSGKLELLIVRPWANGPTGIGKRGNDQIQVD